MDIYIYNIREKFNIYICIHTYIKYHPKQVHIYIYIYIIYTYYRHICLSWLSLWKMLFFNFLNYVYINYFENNNFTNDFCWGGNGDNRQPCRWVQKPVQGICPKKAGSPHQKWCFVARIIPNISMFSELWKNKLISWKRCWWHWHLWACLFGVLDYNFSDGHGLSYLSYLAICNVFIYRPTLFICFPKMGIPLNQFFLRIFA